MLGALDPTIPSPGTVAVKPTTSEVALKIADDIFGKALTVQKQLFEQKMAQRIAKGQPVYIPEPTAQRLGLGTAFGLGLVGIAGIGLLIYFLMKRR